MTDFRALCTELLSALESEGYAHWVDGPDEDDLCLRARAALAEEPAVPAPPADGEVAELVAWLEETGHLAMQADVQEGERYFRTAELLQRQVPVAVSDALVKAECALSDIAEGEPATDEGDPLQWAERRCADTLAIIRPTMRQHKIRTSEWPPVTAHALPSGEVDE